MFLDNNTALPTILSANVTQGPTMSWLEIVLIIIICLVLGVVTFFDSFQMATKSVVETIRGGGSKGGSCGCGSYSRRKK